MTQKGIVKSPLRGFKINIDSVEGTYTTTSSEEEDEANLSNSLGNDSNDDEEDFLKSESE